MDGVDRLGSHLSAVLCRLSEFLETAQLPFAVVGAAALLLHDVELRRTTRDLDLAISVAGGFRALRPVLHDAGLSDTAIEHRFSALSGDEIDVLPIDLTSEPPHEVQLASGDRISAVGLAEAIVHAVRIHVGKHRVPVAPLPLLIANKLHVAATEIRPHDLDDACAAMEVYERAGTRRFDVDYDSHPQLTYETAGAFLSGLDSAAMMPMRTLRTVDAATEALTMDRRLGDRYDHGESRRALVLAFREALRIALEA